MPDFGLRLLQRQEDLDYLLTRMSDLRDQVQKTYSALAVDPAQSRLQPNGRELALALGYPQALLDRLPPACLDSFYGVTNLSAWVALEDGSRVLDLGCGSGVDTVCIAHKLEATGSVVGLDFSEEMLERAGQALQELGLPNVTLQQGDAEALPWPDASFDAAVVNGIFNLNPARKTILAELARVLRPGGRLWAAELILAEPLAQVPGDAESWFT